MKPITIKISILVAVILAILAFSGYNLYNLHSFPEEYRNKPESGFNRPGNDQFNTADERLNPIKGKTEHQNFGNSEKAKSIAGLISKELTISIRKSFSGGSNLNLLEDSDSPVVALCHLNSKECAFLLYIPELRRYESNEFNDNDAITKLAMLSWHTIRKTLRNQNVQDIEIAIGLRGLAHYGPIILGYHKSIYSKPEEGIVKFIKDGSSNTNFFWTFFDPKKK